jgi:peptide/nickel transport system substrate-binding protein
LFAADPELQPPGRQGRQGGRASCADASFFKAAAVGALAVAAPRIGRAERTNKLVFVPTEDLGALDPVIIGIRAARNHDYLVFDTLYGIDTSWMAQPQMVEGHQVDEAGLTWTLTLREGLRFHPHHVIL